MRFRPLLLCSLTLASLGGAIAEDKSESRASSPSDPAAVFQQFNFAKTGPGVLTSGDIAPPGDRVCYTMRSYKVKRTERIKDDESATRGYSTCELASSYHMRSAADVSSDRK